MSPGIWGSIVSAANPGIFWWMCLLTHCTIVPLTHPARCQKFPEVGNMSLQGKLEEAL